MAGPSLDVLLKFDFKDRTQHLAVVKHKKNPAMLVAVDKQHKGKTNDSMATVAKYFEANQNAWLDGCEKKDLPQLETKLAWLAKRVSEYNASHKKKVKYRNPAQWPLKLKIEIKKDAEIKLQKHIVSKSLVKIIWINRLTTQKELYEKSMQIMKTPLSLKVKCLSKTCDTTHSIKIAPKELFSMITWDHVWNIKSKENFIQPNEAGKAKYITCDGDLVTSKTLKNLVSSIHPPAKTGSSNATNASYNTSNINWDFQLLKYM